jgi:hypothetical protein
MATTAKQNLSLGKLRRAIDGNNSYTAAMSMSKASGSALTSSGSVKMSDFSISAVGSLTGFVYLWESTAENYTLGFTNAGGLFLNRIGSRTENFSWTKTGNLNVAFSSADYQATVTAAAISNANTGTGADDDFFAAGSKNQSGSLQVKFTEDGQSDGYNDHATNYNTNRTKAIVVVDAYGGSPSCLLEGTDIQLIDGSYKKVEDLEVGDWLRTIDLPGAIDEDYDNWRQSRFEEGFEPRFHSASVQDINFDFSQTYWDINNGLEKITGEHEMLYKPVGESFWMWQLVPGMKAGGQLMGKDGSSIEITSLEQVHSEDGFEVVQIDVEPLDFYFGNTFLVHNKGSNDDPF